jgi:hypothetical protein
MRIQKAESLSCSFPFPRMWHTNSKNFPEHYPPPPRLAQKSEREMKELSDPHIHKQENSGVSCFRRLKIVVIWHVLIFFWKKIWGWERQSVIWRMHNHETWAIPFPKDNLCILQWEGKKQKIIDKTFVSIHKNLYMLLY